MTVLRAKTALLADGWASDVEVTITDGRIAGLAAGRPGPGALGCLLPAPVNLHSHAFQRAMAGMTERRSAGQDSFWTWRQLMYRFLDRLTPEDVQAIAAFVQMEMAEAGYAAVAEFHYLHHAPDGAAYADRAEMSARIAAAAAESGLGLTLLPVLYQQGGCDGRALGAGQLRFGNDPDGFGALWQGAGRALAGLPEDTRLGVAPHSLRAVSRDGLDFARDLAPEAPLHLHIAEQVAEVAEVQAAYGARPVEWLLADGQFRAIIAGGGDGTLTSVAGLVAGTGVALGVLPLGTMNLLANALSISPDLGEALRQLQGAKISEIDAARAGEQLFLHHVSFGIQPRMVKIREKLGYSSRLTKMLAGLRAMVTVLLNPQSQRLSLEIDGRVVEVKAPAILMSNNLYEDSAWLKQAALDEGVLGIYIVRPMAPLAYLKLALDLLRGRWRANLNVEEERGRSVTLHARRRFGRRAKGIRATIDGELVLLPLPITISSEPGVLKVLAPPPAAG